MGTDQQVTNSEVLPPGHGRFSWAKFAIWLVAAPALGAVAAWIAVVGQFYFAPLLLFPIIVGVGLGAMLVGLLRLAQIGHRSTVWLGAVLAVAVAVVGQHYFSYCEIQRREEQLEADVLQKAQEKFPGLVRDAGGRPQPGFLEYMDRQAEKGRPLFREFKLTGMAVWASWAVDAMLVLIAAIATMIPAVRQPYCSKCRTWYRTGRSGRIPVATAQQIAAVADLAVGEQIKSPRYRLSNCASGCGPTRLELSWEEPDGSTFLGVAWLEPERRDRIARALDDVHRKE